MTPIISHLLKMFPELTTQVETDSLNWTFNTRLKQLGPDFYSKVARLHPILNIEYSVLCQRLRYNLSSPDYSSPEPIKELLIDALKLAELLEYTYQHYLVVPREVLRLRRHKAIYRELLTELSGYSFALDGSETESFKTSLSLTQAIREKTAQSNWYRIFISRSKRVINLLDNIDLGSKAFRDFVVLLDKYTNPFLAYLGWCFFAPRLLTNLFLILKHTIPGQWMGEKEKSLDWYHRFYAHLQRRWFELANDSVWFTVGILNCFVLVGALAPLSVYLSLFAFAFDVANTSLRAYIEISRLQQLQTEYSELFDQEENEDKKKTIKEYQDLISYRIKFEVLRSFLSVGGAAAVVIAMALSVPALGFINPIIPLVGALLLLVLWGVSLYLTNKLDEYRPVDNIEKPAPSVISKLGFFASKNEKRESLYLSAKTEKDDEAGELIPTPAFN
ncbi:hypothetical protein OQJ02_00710 [Legionella sp. PATHC032]|uniref:hypothetical protein n=1 Tax=Legionella sp. PATHC032 TaxID=2992039 RepID=UPI001AFDFB43|nr:hypothetical protein [Legionella sp. PATHC032]MCW8420157.1 hypothetical protein [Legionella sp. PATHC032]HAZ7573589.1 hypothetical protein [Legionella pneumophila]HBA1635311.1 hypothetical protein [Legionella pneumophila]